MKLFKNNRKLIFLIASTLVLSAFGIISPVFAANPTITYKIDGFCNSVQGCNASMNLWGAISNPNPSAFTGDGLIIVVDCIPGGATGIQFNSATDTIGDNWVFVGQFTPGSTVSNNIWVEGIFYTNIVSTVATSFTISVNVSPAALNCIGEVYLASTPITLSTTQNKVSLTYSGTGSGYVSSFTVNLGTAGVSTPTNSLLFISTFLGASGTETGIGENIYTTGFTVLAGYTLQNDHRATYYQFAPNAITQNYNLFWSVSGSTNNYYYGAAMVIIAFSPTPIAPTTNHLSCTGANCGIVSGGATLDASTTFTLTANSTYYYFGTSGSGGAMIQNVSTKIAAYTNGGAGKATNTIIMAIYEMPAGTDIVNYSIVNNKFIRMYNLNFTITTGSTNVWEHLGNPNVAVPANTTYAFSIMSKFSGLSLYHTINPTSPLLISTEGTFSGSTWKPPYVLTSINVTSFNVYLFAFGYQNPVFTVATNTVTTYFSCVAGSTCTVNTQTIWVTATSVFSNMQGGTGGIAMIQNLIYYLPIWMLPLFFVPFGIQGILIGFIFGDILGALEGIVPLWAAFILGLGTLYLLSKRL